MSTNLSTFSGTLWKFEVERLYRSLAKSFPKKESCLISVQEGVARRFRQIFLKTQKSIPKLTTIASLRFRQPLNQRSFRSSARTPGNPLNSKVGQRHVLRRGPSSKELLYSAKPKREDECRSNPDRDHRIASLPKTAELQRVQQLELVEGHLINRGPASDSSLCRRLVPQL
jgi:hypothetical protein